MDETEQRKCVYCGEPFIPISKRGPKSKYCKPSHRRRMQELQSKAEAIELIRPYVPDGILREVERLIRS